MVNLLKYFRIWQISRWGNPSKVIDMKHLICWWDEIVSVFYCCILLQFDGFRWDFSIWKLNKNKNWFCFSYNCTTAAGNYLILTDLVAKQAILSFFKKFEKNLKMFLVQAWVERSWRYWKEATEASLLVMICRDMMLFEVTLIYNYIMFHVGGVSGGGGGGYYRSSGTQMMRWLQGHRGHRTCDLTQSCVLCVVVVKLGTWS